MKVRNIMFTGFMAAILGATSANAAISVASQGYVDAKVGAVSTSVSDLETTVSNTYQTKADAATAASGVETELAKKADKATTLAGYGIDDAYTKAEADEKYLIMENPDALGANLQWTADGKLDTKGIATAEGLDKLDERVNGNASTEGSIAYDIAAALAEAKQYADDNDADTIYDDTALAARVSANETGIAANAQAIANIKEYDDTALVARVSANETGIAANAEAIAQKANSADVYTKSEVESAVDAKLADYTKTSELDAGFVSEAEMTTFKSENDAAIADAKKAGTDAAAAAQEDADANATAITQLQTDLATKITAPAACETQDCVLSINKATGTIAWVPLTEPVADYLD